MRLASPLLQSLPNLSHGFFTREGGVSQGIYASLNCGRGSKDKPEHIRANRARAAQAVGLEPSDLAGLDQTHSAKALVVSTPAAFEGDALITRQPRLALSVLTADCAPILFADPKARLVAAAHAGWRGILSGVIENTLAQMISLGAHASDVHCAVGPCIGRKAYEVGDDFHAAFIAATPFAEEFFAPARLAEKRLFDLEGYICARLKRASMRHICRARACTFSDPRLYFSHRRAQRLGEPDYGRQISIIALN